MTIRKTWPVYILGGVSAVLLFAAAAAAEDKVRPEDEAAVTDGRPDRYSLVAVDDGILRVDRQNGTVSICREQNRSWRCNPVPLAEEAYLAEINELAGEVDRLTARLEELEDGNGKTPGGEQGKSGSGRGDKKDSYGLNKEDEEELERVLTFTESAMRRFFGMVRDLQQDFEGEGN